MIVGHAAQRPRISNQFRVDVECKLAEKNMTVYVKEYYDLQRNRGRLTVEKPLATKDFFMDYDSNMVLMVIPEAGKLQWDQWQLISPFRRECAVCGLLGRVIPGRLFIN